MEADSRASSSQADQTPGLQSSPASDRRKSGRVSKKPELFSQEFKDAGGKRKRTDGDNDNDDDDDEVDEDVSESSDDAADDEPDEEELREKRRASRKSSAKKQSSTVKGKPKSRPTHSAKKQRIGNGVGGQLALRPATNGKRIAPRAKKPKARPSLVAGETGLFAEVFGKSHNADTAAAEWLTQYQQNQTIAMRDLVNFFLKCTGTDIGIEDADITDVDHAPDRIADIQNQYQAQGISEYPLTSKSKTFRAFQPLLEEFVMALIQTFHHSSVLYSDENLFENIQTWIASLSTADFRPFRHTATLISLTIMNALCDVAREVTTTVSTSRKQLESEKKKKSVNKGRVDAIQAAVQDGEKKLEALDEYLQDGINTVFVHRYRDVDPRIRCECMTALGQWIRSYREFFFEGQYLRYLGWMLSDEAAQTRSVAVSQLLSFYENKDNIAGLRSFTERFRQRMVEMAAQDADVGVRALAVDLLDLIRDAGLIEPGDIDIIGRLVFDSEPRVRKAAGRFFVANIQDVFDSITDEVSDEINDLFGDEDEDGITSPKRSWIKFKCLADVLQVYDTQENESKSGRSMTASRDMLSGVPLGSRFILATEAIYPHLEELSHWQALAGYLLYDHSQITDASAGDDTAGVIRNLYKMQEGQEVILLEVLCSAVKLRVLDIAKSDIDKRGRKVKALTNKIPELQEEMTYNLAWAIPQLLNKFGAVPEAASAVLRLSHQVDLDKMQDLQKNAVAYSSLLNDINKHFLTHSDQDVLAEASVVFLHAKSSDDMREAQENKMQELWDNMLDALRTLSQEEEVREGSSIPTDTLTELANTVLRISNLVSVSDCTAALEAVPSSRSKKQGQQEAPFNIFIHIVRRGLREQEEDEDAARLETDLVANSMKTLLFYFMWKVQSMRTALSIGKAAFNTEFFEALAKSREVLVAALVAIMRRRSGLDDMRFTATTTLLDLQTLFGTLRHAGQTADNDEDVITQTQSLAHDISFDVQELITKIHASAERVYAKKIRRPLEPAEDDAPASESELGEEPSDEDDSDNEDESATNERLRSTILAEKRLCELTGKMVLAIIGHVLDASGAERGKLKQKLLRNKSRLGNNYREVVTYLEERKPKARPAAPKGKQPVNGGAPRGGASGHHAGEHKSTERIDDEDEEENAEVAANVEEDEEEDLQARGLLEEDNADRNDDDEDAPPAPDPDEDEVMGD